jgi:hypothetical protein
MHWKPKAEQYELQKTIKSFVKSLVITDSFELIRGQIPPGIEEFAN